MSDLIDRQETISVVSFAMADSPSITREDWNAIIEAVQCIPSASPDLSEEDMRLIKKLRSFHNGSYAVVLDKLITSACNETKQQATVSSDCISRQDAIDAINAYLGLSAVSRTIQNMTSIQEILEKLPAVDTDLSTFSDKLWKIAYERGKAEGRKKGKWIDKSDDIDGAWNYCSVCMEQAIDLYDFCPNCGADMREGESDDN